MFDTIGSVSSICFSMNINFLSTFLAVLNDQQEIPELPSNNLRAFDWDEPSVEREIPNQLLLKVARLQTLGVLVNKQGKLPDFEETNRIAELTGVSFMETAANALCTSEDSTYRCMMLERVIIEVVRGAIPTECHYFDVSYFVHRDRTLRRRPMSQRRFLD